MAQARVTAATPQRWQKAAERAIREGVQIRQVNSNGMWVATSGTRSNIAYVVEVNQGVALSCTCEAGQFGDECCKHRAAFYLLTGLLDGPTDDGAAVAAA
jgi:uncharacterized Zn finger protein